MQDIKRYTDENYIAITDLINLGPDFVDETKQYRRFFIEIIPLNDIEFVNIVETPKLIKKRFSKNVEIKGKIDINAENNDYILEIAKLLVKNYDIPELNIISKEDIIQKYKENDNDLTIVTNYLINNIDKLIIKKTFGDLKHIFPELSLKDKEFIKNFNDTRFQYSILDYQSITKSSYETGRKSLEKLTQLNLYEKKKVGKKFVYKPTMKLNEIMKGVK